MVKKTDTSKIERIREASIAIISEQGIPGSSVAAIAERAQVSAGYLYRHYPGKEELINDLLDDVLNTITDQIHLLIAKHDRIEEIVSGIIGFILESVSENPHKLKFLVMLLNDFSTPINPALREQMQEIGLQLIRKGKESGSVRENVSVEDFYIALVGIPLQYLAVRYKFEFISPDRSYDEREVQKITEISMCAIQ